MYRAEQCKQPSNFVVGDLRLTKATFLFIMVNHRHAFLKLFSALRNLSLNGQATPTEFPFLNLRCEGCIYTDT